MIGAATPQGDLCSGQPGVCSDAPAATDAEIPENNC